MVPKYHWMITVWILECLNVFLYSSFSQYASHFIFIQTTKMLLVTSVCWCHLPPSSPTSPRVVVMISSLLSASSDPRGPGTATVYWPLWYPVNPITQTRGSVRVIPLSVSLSPCLSVCLSPCLCLSLSCSHSRQHQWSRQCCGCAPLLPAAGSLVQWYRTKYCLRPTRSLSVF